MQILVVVFHILDTRIMMHYFGATLFPSHSKTQIQNLLATIAGHGLWLAIRYERELCRNRRLQTPIQILRTPMAQSMMMAGQTARLDASVFPRLG